MLKYTLEYLDAVKAERNERVREKTKELQVIYDVNKLKVDKSRADLKFNRMVIAVAIVFLVILTVLLIAAMKVLKRTRFLKDKAESANRLKTAFIQNMSHEIRTPLNAIVGFSDMLTDEQGVLQQSEKIQFSKLIRENTEILLNQVNDVMDIAQMETGDIKINKSDCSLNWLCDYCISVAKEGPHCTDPSVVMSFIPHKEDIVVITDKQKIIRLLDNFLSNAAKFTKNGSIVLDYEKNHDGKEILFSVTDTGIGVPEEKAETIFETFEKLDQFEQGTGLGLHVCRLIAHALGGEVYLDTLYHGGSRFLFALPLK